MNTEHEEIYTIDLSGDCEPEKVLAVLIDSIKRQYDRGEYKREILKALGNCKKNIDRINSEFL